MDISLPFKKGYAKLVVDADVEDCASSIRDLHLRENPVVDVEGAERLVAVKGLHCRQSSFEVVPFWIASLQALEKVGKCAIVHVD